MKFVLAQSHFHCRLPPPIRLTPFPFLLQTVIQVSKKFLPSLSVGFEDPRVEVHVEDGSEFMKKHRNKFDVIITDSSDPVGEDRLKVEAKLNRH